jgi:lysophospholipase L1-like esterase
MTDQPNPEIPAHATIFVHRLKNLADRVVAGGPIKIVAIGSSSTAGESGIAPYPIRLEMALREAALFKSRMIDVINRGVSGQEVPDEAKRLQADVIDEQPALVIWQVGTNEVWKADIAPATVARQLDDGLDLLLRSRVPMDIVLMDLQYAPAVISDNRIKACEQMVSLIAQAAANRPPVNLFRRFDLMRRWHEVEHISFDRMINPSDASRLHHSDWCSTRIGQALCEAIVEAVTRPE